MKELNGNKITFPSGEGKSPATTEAGDGVCPLAQDNREISNLSTASNPPLTPLKRGMQKQTHEKATTAKPSMRPKNCNERIKPQQNRKIKTMKRQQNPTIMTIDKCKTDENHNKPQQRRSPQ